MSCRTSWSVVVRKCARSMLCCTRMLSVNDDPNANACRIDVGRQRESLKRISSLSVHVKRKKKSSTRCNIDAGVLYRKFVKLIKALR
jgi:hypothetical protein